MDDVDFGEDMIIKSLKLKNYRNYDLLDLHLDANTNILYGDNAQGKTNVLEALSVRNNKVTQRGKGQRFDSAWI